MRVSVKVDYGKTYDAIKRLEQSRGMVAGLSAAALYLKGKLAVYPARKTVSRKSVYGRSFASDAQRRFVMMLIRRGDVPYRRGGSRESESFGRRWSTQSQRGGLEQVIGNNASYARYLMDDEEQSRYHAAVGWRKVGDIVNRERGEVIRIVQSGVDRDLR